MQPQQTIEKRATIQGRGLFSGTPAVVTFKPAPANHGVGLVRRDLDGARLPALVTHVVKRSRRTALRTGSAIIETCEHVRSAIAALQIDDIEVEIDGPEFPGLDGSAGPYLDVLAAAGLKSCDAPRMPLVVTEPVMV